MTRDHTRDVALTRARRAGADAAILLPSEFTSTGGEPLRDVLLLGPFAPGQKWSGRAGIAWVLRQPFEAMERGLEDPMQCDFVAWRLLRGDIVFDRGRRAARLRRQVGAHRQERAMRSWAFHAEGAEHARAAMRLAAMGGGLGRGTRNLYIRAIRWWCAVHAVEGLPRRYNFPMLSGADLPVFLTPARRQALAAVLGLARGEATARRRLQRLQHLLDALSVSATRAAAHALTVETTRRRRPLREN